MSGHDHRPQLERRLRIDPGSKVRLGRLDPNETHGYVRDAAATKMAADLAALESLQERIWAEHNHRILVVLQGIDASGKDGAIKHLLSTINPQGTRVVGFGVPTAPELAHDYLWRIHAATPGTGEIVLFNRSHYESVLVERVHDLVTRPVWSRRYDQINEFERILTDEGTTIVKLFLHISEEEQLERLRARYEDPTKRWKFNVRDLEERQLWGAYQAAFEDALERCSTKAAPWYVIPSDHKWFRNLAAAEILRERLEALKPEYPVRADLPKDLVIE
jgi:PPK2 family polyphosphate:nucleotide phosphotransferase